VDVRWSWWKGLIHGYFHSSHGKSFLVILQLAVRNSYSSGFCPVLCAPGLDLHWTFWTSPVFPVDFRSFGARSMARTTVGAVYSSR
jgi:hypothetical protein